MGRGNGAELLFGEHVISQAVPDPLREEKEQLREWFASTSGHDVCLVGGRPASTQASVSERNRALTDFTVQHLGETWMPDLIQVVCPLAHQSYWQNCFPKSEAIFSFDHFEGEASLAASLKEGQLLIVDASESNTGELPARISSSQPRLLFARDQRSVKALAKRFLLEPVKTLDLR